MTPTAYKVADLNLKEATLEETKRTNRAREAETQRANKMNELISAIALPINAVTNVTTSALRSPAIKYLLDKASTDAALKELDLTRDAAKTLFTQFYNRKKSGERLNDEDFATFRKLSRIFGLVEKGDK